MPHTKLDTRKPSHRRLLIGAAVIALLLPYASHLLADDPQATGSKLMAHQLHLLHSGAIHDARAQMRRDNPEWDFMGRTFLALSLANLALQDEARAAAYLEDLDGLIDATLSREEQAPADHFLLPYVHRRPFIGPTGRSLFIDGEIALMLAARQSVQRLARHDGPLKLRIERILVQMQASPVLSGESYPNENWTFCNTFALAAIRLHDVAYGEDHSEFFARWVKSARENLLDAKTGLLVSSFDYNGRHQDGPEGSSLWVSVHNLQIIDPAFARQQYELARKHLRGSLMGYGYAREWPRARPGQPDVDSGLIVPGLEASAASSGLALVATGAFGDHEFARELVRSLHAAASPVEQDGRLHFAASNQVGDAAMAYGLIQGPLWQRAMPKRTEAPR